jgi:hypothetical protein
MGRRLSSSHSSTSTQRRAPFGCCLRLDDVDAFFQTCVVAGLPVATQGWPRLHPPKVDESGLRIGALIDMDGTLLRLIANA